MTLQSELDAFKASWLERVGDETAKMVEDDNAALKALGARALKAGAMFPSVKLPDHKGGMTDLAALMAEGPVVVTFYRGGWCPYCNLELRAFQKSLPQIEGAGARLVAISPETPDNSLSTAEKNGLAFDVLSDSEGLLADALGIRFELSSAMKAYFVKAGHDLPTRNGDDKWSLPMPATYVVEKGGRVALAHVDPDYRRRMDPGVALAALRDLAGSKAA